MAHIPAHNMVLILWCAVYNKTRSDYIINFINDVVDLYMGRLIYKWGGYIYVICNNPFMNGDLHIHMTSCNYKWQPIYYISDYPQIYMYKCLPSMHMTRCIYRWEPTYIDAHAELYARLCGPLYNIYIEWHLSSEIFSFEINLRTCMYTGVI